MKTRTLAILVLVVAFIAAGALVLRGDSKNPITTWFRSMHGGGGGH